ncbi:MAG: cell division protein ZapA [Cocleimonas sp.]|nr:cell division protein ZapA [Cocleimonas sp.]
MSNNSIPVTVRIADKEYKISCPEGEHEALMSSARRVNEDMKKIRESGKALGAERIAVMAALNIASELFNVEGAQTIDPDISARLDALQQSVDTALNTH